MAGRERNYPWDSVSWSSFKRWITWLFCCTWLRNEDGDHRRSQTDSVEFQTIGIASEQQELCGQCQGLTNNLVNGYQAKITNLERESRLLYEEKHDLLQRLGQMASVRLRDNNPNIVDLSDQFRPTKLADMFSELYDNEWTSAYDAMEKKKFEDREIISFLLDIVMEAFVFCQQKCNLAWQMAEGWFLNENLPSNMQTRKTLKDAMKNNVPRLEPQVLQDFNRFLGECSTRKCPGPLECIADDKVKPYIAQCIKLCLYMVTTDPPIVLHCPRWKPLRRPKYSHTACKPDVVEASEPPQLAQGPANSYSFTNRMCLKTQSMSHGGKPDTEAKILKNNFARQCKDVENGSRTLYKQKNGKQKFLTKQMAGLGKQNRCPFDAEHFRYFTRRGEFQDFTVWPAMLLHTGGKMLCKGVAQAKK